MIVSVMILCGIGLHEYVLELGFQGKF